ncbi:MAG: SRPBCC family protein [Actinomycetota bacterium]
MDLNNSFVVPADINTAWQTLLDVEAIAPCMPGATLESVDGDNFTGSVKVKLGPVNMTYGGKARFLEKNEAEHKAVIEGTGKETRGSGTASALVTCQLVSEGSNQTRVDVVTDLTVTGKPAQFGRGVMQDVAGRIIEQFSANLAATMAAGAASSSASDSTGSATPTPLPQVADSIDLLGTAGAPVLKRAIPALIAVVAVVGIIWLIARRRG